MSQTIDDIEPKSHYYPSEGAQYSVEFTTEGSLVICLNQSSRKFYRWAIPLFVVLLGTAITSFIFISTGFDRDIGSLFGLLFGSISSAILGTRLFFRLIKKTKWEFTETELVIYNDFYFRKRVPRELIRDISVEQNKSYYGVSDYELKYWIILQVPADLYEDGRLYLLMVDGGNTAALHNPDADITENTFGPEPTFILFKLIAGHWNLSTI